MDSRFKQTGVYADVVVIGGGLAGLAAASYLARAGVAVTLYEKAESLGGRGATQQHSEYRFNRGIHALYRGGALEDVLRELGVAYTGRSPKDVFVLQGGKLHPFPSDPLSLLRTRLLGAAGKLELMRLFATLPRIDARELARVSVEEWLDRNFRRPDARRFMAAFARTNIYSSALDLVSADVLVQKLQRQLKHGVLYIDGGWRSLVDGLRTVAERAGARIMRGKRVEAVEYRDGQVRGVRLADGTAVPASGVVIASTPNDALRLIDGGSYLPLRSIVDGLVPAQVACLDVALRYLPRPQHPVVQDIDGPRFMSAQSLYSHVAPEGGAMVYTFKQLDPTSPTNPHDDERDLENLLDTVQPGWRDALVKRVFMPRIDAVGALPMAGQGGFAGRPQQEVPGIANLYLAGDWVGPEGFLSDASAASGRNVAQHLLQLQVLAEEQQVPHWIGETANAEWTTAAEHA